MGRVPTGMTLVSNTFASIRPAKVVRDLSFAHPA
jgi:hypothetical protein